MRREKKTNPAPKKKKNKRHSPSAPTRRGGTSITTKLATKKKGEFFREGNAGFQGVKTPNGGNHRGFVGGGTLGKSSEETPGKKCLVKFCFGGGPMGPTRWLSCRDHCRKSLPNGRWEKKIKQVPPENQPPCRFWIPPNHTNPTMVRKKTSRGKQKKTIDVPKIGRSRAGGDENVWVPRSHKERTKNPPTKKQNSGFQQPIKWVSACGCILVYPDR